MITSSFLFVLLYFVINFEKNLSIQIDDGKTLLNRSIAKPDSDGFYHFSNYDFTCFRQLAICSTHGWSLRFKIHLNPFTVVDRERKYLLFSTGAHEPHGDGMLIYLYQSKNTSYLEFGLKEFRNDQFAYYWHVEVDLEVKKWIDVVTTIEEHVTPVGQHHQMTIFFDGQIYKETQVENYTEVFVFKYDQLHPKEAIIYGNDSGLLMFDEMVYYERVLSEEEIEDISPDRVSMGCLKDNDRMHQYVIPETFDKWQTCRKECEKRRMKIGIYSTTNGQCACIESTYELETSFKLEKNFCKCQLTKSNKKCREGGDWHVMSVSNVIDLIDSEVGLEIRLADSSYLTHGRTRVQINEGVEIVVTVKNERNLASLTVYGDIEGQEVTHSNSNSSSNEIYITAGVVNLSWKNEGAKKVQFRADYKRMVNYEMAEYRTVYVDVVYIKTDLPLQFVHFSPDSRDGQSYQNFTIQTFGSVPINCTVDYGDGNLQTNGTNREQYYTAFFGRNYTRYGQYNVSARCYNDRSSNTTSFVRNIRRENMNRKMIITKDLMETPTATRFNLISKEDFSFRHSSCLYLKDVATNEKMKLIWRKKTLEIIPNDVLPVGKHFYQLECDSVPLQAYYVNVQPAIRSLDIEASHTTIKSGQSIQYSITLEPTFDLTIIFDCGTPKTPLEILHIEQVRDMSPIFVANCTYSKPGHYQPLVSALNRINLVNQSLRIDVEEPLSQFRVEIEDRPDINQLTLVTISALERIPFEGIFTFTITDSLSVHEVNQTRTERIQLLSSNNFTEQFYMNISTYGRQVIHVRGGDYPTIREAQATFTIGSEITTKPQVFVVNQMGLVNEDIVWIDIQWINGIGFDVQIDFGHEKKILLRYGQIITSPVNRLNKKDEEYQWKRLAKRRFQVGYKFTKVGTHKIDVTFIQSSTKLLTVEISCPIVTIVQGIIESDKTCFQEQQFLLDSPNSLNNITEHSPVLLLPYSLQHNLEPVIMTSCAETDLIYSFYLLSVDSSLWKFSRTQRYSLSSSQTFDESFLSQECSELGPKSTLTIEPKSLPHGYYLAVYTVSMSTNQADFRQFTQPIEIIRSDLTTTFGGNQTITNDGENIRLNFYSTTNDPDVDDFDRRKLNFTLICYPEDIQSLIFSTDSIDLGSSRPTEANPQNQNPWLIHWDQLTLMNPRSEYNIHIYEKQCFVSNTKKELISFDPKTKVFNMTEQNLDFNNQTMHFLLIVRHIIDGRQLITRYELTKRVTFVFDNADLSQLEEVMGNLDDLAAANPTKAVALITGLADKLNEMSDNTTMGEMNDDEVKAMNDRMASMRSKMLTSMDTVIDSANDPDMMNKALRASATVTANSDQMPLNNQEKGANIIEKVGSKVKDMENADDSTVTGLATSLLDVGGNVLQAATRTVSKDKENDPAAVIESLEAEMKVPEEDEEEDLGTETKVLYAPTQFYDACDECDTLPEDRWEEFRHKLEEEKKMIIEGRERASTIAKRSSTGLFTVGDVLANRASDNETKSIESKTMAMSFAKAPPDGKSSVSAGDTTIRLPGLSDLNSSPGSSNVFTKVLESKENPYASAHGNSNVQGSVVSIILSRPDGSEMPVTNSTKPIAIRLTRPVDKRPKYQQHYLYGTNFSYHKVNLPEKEMALSIYVSPNFSPMDTYGIYVSYGVNESLLEPPTESKFDLLFVLPNRTVLPTTSDIDQDDENELRHTVFIPPSVHFGNGTYIFGIRLINSSTVLNLTEYNSSYTINMYTSKCQYWDEKKFVWSSDGCQVGPLTTLKSTECLCTHLTTFGSDFYVPPNTIDFKTVFKKFKKLHENAAVFSTVIVIFGLYVIAAVWARRADKKDLVKWTAAPLVDNLPIDNYHYLITIHTGVGKEAGTTSNVSFVMAGELSDSGVRKLSDGKTQEFKSGSVRNFQMSVESPLGPLLYLRVWHDNSGVKEKASWYLNMINVMDLQTGEKSYFLCDNWLGVEKGDGLVDRVIPLASSKELKSFAHLFTQSVKKKFSDGHLWFSVFSRPVRSNFTRLQRISCCISLLFCTMISNAMFYRQETQATANKAGVLMKIGPIQFTMTQLWVSFIGTLIVLPVNLIIVTLFRKAKYSQKILISHHLQEIQRKNANPENDVQYQKTKKFFTRSKKRSVDDEIERIGAIPSVEDKTRTLPSWTIYIAWALVLLSILTCSFFIILYSLEWGAKRANEWLMTMLLSFGQSILVIDPFKVFLITAIISFLIRKPYDDETLDFNDPFTGTLVSNITVANDDIFNDSKYKEIARQRRIRLFDLRPIDSKEMARAREQRLREIKMGEIIREIVVYIFFTVILLFLSYQARDTNSYGLYRDTKNLFVTDEFHDVSSLSSWWDYCDNVLIKGLYAQPWYNEKNLTWREKLTVASRTSMRVGAPRIRQLRVKENSCRVHRKVKHVITHCRDDYNWFDDDTKDYSVGWKQVLNKTAARMSDESSNGTKRCRTPWCYQNSARTKSGPMKALYKTYKGGGYVVSLGRTFDKSRALLAELRQQNWLNQFTRAVIIDFSLYNANVNLFVAVTLSFEMTSMGSVIQDHQIKIFRLYDHVGGFGIFVYIFEFLFVIFTIYSVVHEVSLLIKLKRGYFDKFWNVISFITAVFSVSAIGMYGTKKTLTRLAVRSLRKSEMGEFVNFNAIASFDEVYSYIVALITFFTMLKFLKLLRFNKRIDMLSKSLRYARQDLSSFGFVFIIFMIAYAIMGFGVFGRSLSSYKSFFTALTTCFRMLLGEINAPDMFGVSRLYGSFYFLSFIILVFIALLSIFLTILNDSFAHVKRELAASQQRNEMMDFMLSTFRKVAGINNRKPVEDEQDKMKKDLSAMLNTMNQTSDAPLAKFDADDF